MSTIANGGHRTIEHAARQRHDAVAAGRGVVKGLHRRRRRAEHDHRAGLARAHHGDVARVIPRRLLLLVGAVVLLVDDDQAEAGDGREDRGAHADDHVHVAAAIRCHWSCRSPSDRPLWWMATRAPKAPRKSAATAGVSAISGTSTSTPVPGARTAPPGADNLGLAAARDAVQKNRLEVARSAQRPERLDTLRLLGRERDLPARDAGSAACCSNGSRSTRPAVDGDEPELHQPSDRRGADAVGGEHRGIDAIGCGAQQRDRLDLSRAARQCLRQGQCRDPHGAKGRRRTLEWTRDDHQPVALERRERAIDPAAGRERIDPRGLASASRARISARNPRSRESRSRPAAVICA